MPTCQSKPSFFLIPRSASSSTIAPSLRIGSDASSVGERADFRCSKMSCLLNAQRGEGDSGTLTIIPQVSLVYWLTYQLVN